MSRKFLVTLLGVLSLAAGAWAQTAAQSPYGRAERRDPIFLRFPEMAEGRLAYSGGPDDIRSFYRASPLFTPHTSGKHPVSLVAAAP